MPGGRWDGRRTVRDGAGAPGPIVHGQPAEKRRRPTASLALAPMLSLFAAALGMVGCAGSSGRADAGVGSGGTGVAEVGGAPSVDASAAMDAPPDGAADRPGGTGGAATAGVDGGDARGTDGGDATATPPLPPIAIGPCRWRGVGVTHDLRFSADGSKLIVAGGPYFKVFDAATGAHGAASGWQSGDIAAMTVSPDGRWFGGYSSRTTGTGASVWRVADPGQGSMLSSHPQKGFAFSPDSSLVAIASEQLSNQVGATVSVFRLSDLSRVATMTVAQWSSSDMLMFSADGAYLMAGFVTATRSWRTTDWSPGPAGLSFPVRAEAPNELHNDAFSAARDLDAGFGLSLADSLSLTLIGNATRAVKAPPAVLFSAVAVSHDGALVAAGAQDGRVLVYQPSDDFLLQLDDTPPAPRTFTHAAGRISVVAFSPDDRQLAAVGADGTLDMWRLSDGARIWSAAGVGGESDLYNAFLIAASADSGTLLVAPGNDNAVLLDATADVVKGRLSGPDAGMQVGDCAASPEATAMVCADSDRAWLLTPGNTPRNRLARRWPGRRGCAAGWPCFPAVADCSSL